MFNFNLLDIIIKVPAILVGFTFHEYAHAVVADRLGDKTPKFQGRLTLNPLVHIDIVGFIMIIIAGFGWAKPVQTNPTAYRNYYKDDLKVSIAGPLANFVVAVFFALITGVFLRVFLPGGTVPPLVDVLFRMLNNIIFINIMLFFFNLLPLPGLDGFHVLMDLFPSRFYHIAEQMYRYQMIILIIIIATPVAGILIGKPTSLVYNVLWDMISKIAG